MKKIDSNVTNLTVYKKFFLETLLKVINFNNK